MTQSLEDILETEVLLSCRINGKFSEDLVPPAISLLDYLREQKGMTGTHMGCMTGHCGACTVMIDGQVAKSCLTLAATVGGRTITTIEGVQPDADTLSVIQQAFHDANAFQCGFCAPGMVLATVELLKENAAPTDSEIRAAIAGNLCRCTGYRSIVAGAQLAATRLRDAQGVGPASTTQRL